MCADELDEGALVGIGRVHDQAVPVAGQIEDQPVVGDEVHTGSEFHFDICGACLLADEVAPTAAVAADQVATRVLKPWREDRKRLLGCRLQENAKTGRVTLSADTIAALSKATGSCDKPGP